MRITKNFRTDQDLITRFLDVLGGGAALLSGNKHASPGFFIYAHNFINEYINEGFFKKEVLLFEALENNGFPTDQGPIGAMFDEQKKCRDAAAHMLSAAKSWQEGDEEARGEVGWAASEYTTTLRQHLTRLKNLIFPLLDQNLSPEDEHKISVGLNTIAFEKDMAEDSTKYVDLIVTLEEELAEWK